MNKELHLSHTYANSSPIFPFQGLLFPFFLPIILCLWLISPSMGQGAVQAHAATLSCRIDMRIVGYNLFLDAVLTERMAENSDLTYQWYQSSNGGITYEPIAGATTPTLRLDRITMPDQIAYSCQVKEKYTTSNRLIYDLYRCVNHRDLPDHADTWLNWYPALYEHKLITPSGMWGDQISSLSSNINEAAQIMYTSVFSCEWLSQRSFDPYSVAYTLNPVMETQNTPKQLIVSCYRFLLGRLPSDAEISYWYDNYFNTNHPLYGVCGYSLIHPYHAGYDQHFTAYRSMMNIINLISESQECKNYMAERYDYNPQTGRFLYTQSDISQRTKEFQTTAYSGIIPYSYYLRMHTIEYYLQNVDGSFPASPNGSFSTGWVDRGSSHFYNVHYLPSQLLAPYEESFSNHPNMPMEQRVTGRTCSVNQNETDRMYLYRKVFTVQCIDLSPSENKKLGTASPILQALYGASLSGSTWGSDSRENIYYSGYHYTDCSSVPFLTENTDLYRYFAPNSYNIVFQLNGGSFPASAPGNQPDGSMKISCSASFGIPFPLRSGFTFVGWKISGAEKQVPSPCLSQSFQGLRTKSGTVTFTALWQDESAPTVRISYKKADGTPYQVNTWTNQSVTATAAASDTGSGISYIQWDTQPPIYTPQGGNSSQTFSLPGKYSGTVNVCDNAASANTAAGQAWIAAAKSNLASAPYGPICIDQLSPVLTDQTPGLGENASIGGNSISSALTKEYPWVNHTVVLTFQASDPAPSSGLKEICIYQSDSAFAARSQVAASISGNISYQVDTEGITYWIVSASDQVGNQTSLLLTLRIDYQAPQLAASLTTTYHTDQQPGSSLRDHQSSKNLDILDGVIAIDQDAFQTGESLVLSLTASELPSVNDGSFSGLKYLNYKITNHDNGAEKTVTQAFTPAEAKNAAASSITLADPQAADAEAQRLFSGNFSIFVEVGDYAGNGDCDYGSLSEYRLQVSAASKFFKTKTAEPPYSPVQHMKTTLENGQTAEGFLRAGEDFLLQMHTAGYIDAITITFPTSCMTKQGGRSFTWIADGSSPQPAESQILRFVQKTDSGESIVPVTTPNAAPCYTDYHYQSGAIADNGERNTEYELLLPQDSLDGSDYCITITAYKKKENGDTPILVNEKGHISNPNQLYSLQRKIYFNVEGNIFDNLRTTLTLMDP